MKRLKRYCKRVRQSDEDDEGLIHRPITFGDITAADHMFPSQEARGLSDEQSALVDAGSKRHVLRGSDGYSQGERNEQANFESLRHFAGRYLSDKNGVLSASDNAKELTGAASKLGWIPDPSFPGFCPHNSSCGREVRTLKELARPAHVAAGFHRKFWPLSVGFTAKAKTFFGLCPVLRHERGTEPAKLKQAKTRYEIAVGRPFAGPKYPLGALVFYKTKGDGISEPSTRPGIFAGWHVSPGLTYKGRLLILDYEALRARSHLGTQSNPSTRVVSSTNRED